MSKVEVGGLRRSEKADFGPENEKIAGFRAENGSNGLVFAPAGEFCGLADPAGQKGVVGRVVFVDVEIAHEGIIGRAGWKRAQLGAAEEGESMSNNNVQFPMGELAFRINLWHSSPRERVVPKGQGVGLGGAAPVGDSGRDQRVHKR